MICALGFKVARPFSRRQGRMITHRGDVLLRAITKGGEGKRLRLGKRAPSTISGDDTSLQTPCAMPASPVQPHNASPGILSILAEATTRSLGEVSHESDRAGSDDRTSGFRSVSMNNLHSLVPPLKALIEGALDLAGSLLPSLARVDDVDFEHAHARRAGDVVFTLGAGFLQGWIEGESAGGTVHVRLTVAGEE